MRAMPVADLLAASAAPEETCWGSLRETVESYLFSGGLPIAHAVRASHEIVVSCAKEADVGSRSGRVAWALAEAETVLEGWRASRRGATPTAA